jgi:cation-transporting ATPase 13A3/4/5
METKIPRKGQVPVLALVTETGFNTMKGQLIRSIMFPQENSFQFYVDSMKFIGVMAVIAVIGFCCTVPNKIHTLLDGSITTWDFISEGLDLITITVPPALPTCLQIGVSIALSRLQAKTIYCICPPKVNICGKVTVMCFDKTGTLTEEGLDLYGVRSVGHVQSQNCSRFQDVVTTCDQLKKQHNSSFEEFQTGNFKSN